METRVIKLDNNMAYAIIYTVTINEDRYVFLVNINDDKDLKVRKIVTIDEVEYLDYLDNVEEFEKVMLEFKNTFNKKEDKNEEE